MMTNDNHAWWSRLRHQGLLLSPVVLLERYPAAPLPVSGNPPGKLRDAFLRFNSNQETTEKSILAWVDALLGDYLGHQDGRLAKQHSIPEKLTAAVRIGSRIETIQPHRVVFADAEKKTPALLVMADGSPQIGQGRGRTPYARLLELLRGTGHRLGLLTNGRQFRLIYAGLDFESWCEWESDRWFDDGEGSEELAGLRHLLRPDEVKEDDHFLTAGLPGLLDAVEESRKRQADLSSVLRENVRQAVELLLDEVSAAHRTEPNLLANLVVATSDRPLTDAEAQEALLQATVRLVMRLVVCLFAESRQLLPVQDPVYASSYGVRTLYETLEEAGRHEGGTQSLLNRRTAWPRLMALFRLIHGGSPHGQFPLRPYSGVLFRPGHQESTDPVVRALHLLEHAVTVSDFTVYRVLRKLLRGPLPVIRGRARTFVEGPVDYTDLRTEFIGLIYEGLLDYRLKRTDEKIGPQVFLNLGREPVLPLARLEDMLTHDKKGLKDLLTTLRKENVSGGAVEDEEEAAEEKEEQDVAEAEVEVEVEPPDESGAFQGGDYLDADAAAKRWAREAVVLAGLVSKKGRRETDIEYQARIAAEADRLIKRTVGTGEFYLVRAGNTRKGTGTFYTRPQLAVPTVHRTLEPLCYEKADDGTLTPKTPEAILGMKVCDPACGSASFLVAALHYLTEALYKALVHHCRIDEPEQAQRRTLPFGRVRTDEPLEDLLKFPANDPYYGDHFEDWMKARLRRHVVERCLYGVDINPLAVELARVSLWVETLDPGLPFSFLDHKIKVGNSLVGCWLDRLLDYPLRAWEREGGDGKDGPRTRRIEEFLKGSRQGNRRTGDGTIKQEMRDLLVQLRDQRRGQLSLFPEDQYQPLKIVEVARAEYEHLHAHSPDADPDLLEKDYQEKLRGSPSVQRLRAAMDEWCAIWFWPADEESLRHVPTPREFHQETQEKTEIVRRIVSEMKFFHWELEFPDVFTRDRSGFDALMGNPPWDVIEPNSQEFFTDFDPLYRTYDKQKALRRQKELFESVLHILEQWKEYNARFKALSNWVKGNADPFDVALARGGEDRDLKTAWQKHRNEHTGFADADHPFRLTGTGKANSYKLFAEVFWHLLRHGGRLGVILPTGLYSDFGTRDLRETLLFHGRLDFLYAFQNEKKIFSAADHRFKQVALFATKGGSTRGFLTRFRMGVGDSPHAHELPDDILKRDAAAMCFTPQDVKLNSPKTLSLVELKSERDLAIFRKIYANSIRIGDNAPGWEITYAQEINMTSDSKHFPPREKWEAKGYKPDVFGRWIGPDGSLAFPLYQGRIINHFNFWACRFVSGAGRNVSWIADFHDHKKIGSQYLMAQDVFRNMQVENAGIRLIFRDIARSTDTRTMIACVVPHWPCNNKLPLLFFQPPSHNLLLVLSAYLSSLCFDWSIRNRLAGASLNWFIVEECPIPKSEPPSRLGEDVSRLTLLHRCFAPEWLKLKHLYSVLSSKEWKHWWAVTEADRLRLRVEIEALCTDLYGLDPDDFDWIVRDDPTDPKGFYRVDRTLPFPERLTGLAAAAFRALKEGKWSEESAANLTNDEFFTLIGIPEMTAEPDPLIGKRDGCHHWKPEEFGPDDPRYGWTWEDCWKDAVALLGSEKAVKEYVEGEKEKKTVGPGNEEPGKKRPTDLFGEPLPPKQGKLF